MANRREIELLQYALIDNLPLLKKNILSLVQFYRKYFTVCKILKLLKIDRNNYYYWRKVHDKNYLKKMEKRKIIKKIGFLCQKYHFAFGYRKITFLYQKIYQVSINKKFVLKIMQQNNWLKKWNIPNTKNHDWKKFQQTQKNLIQKDFRAQEPFTKLYTDLTCFTTNKGYFWLSTIIDGYNNKIVASSFGKQGNLQLVKKTFRQIPKLKKPCFIHSDQGKVYQSIYFQKYLNKKGFMISMSAKASPNENAVIESYFSNLKGYFRYHEPQLFQNSFEKINQKIKKFTSFYNKEWIFAKLNYQSPHNFRKEVFQR
ncbi:MAG: IS3 family transposase [Pigeon pea little leaf phytoplasma]|nr:IS3 family transposase [Pigeon pea little leaf phytoplasma]